MLIRTIMIMWIIPPLLPDQITVMELKIAMSTCHQMHPQNTMTTECSSYVVLQIM